MIASRTTRFRRGRCADVDSDRDRWDRPGDQHLPVAADDAGRLPAARLRQIVRGEEILAAGGTGTVYGGIVPEAAALGVELIPTTYAPGHARRPGRARGLRRAARRDPGRDRRRAAGRRRPARAAWRDGALRSRRRRRAAARRRAGAGRTGRADRRAARPPHQSLGRDDRAGERPRRLQGVSPHRHARDRRAGAADPGRDDPGRGEADDGAHPPAADRPRTSRWSPPGNRRSRSRSTARARWSSEPGVLAATVLGGFPFADVPFAGVSTIVVTDNDPALARRYADELADDLLGATRRLHHPPHPDRRRHRRSDGRRRRGASTSWPTSPIPAPAARPATARRCCGA